MMRYLPLIAFTILAMGMFAMLLRQQAPIADGKGTMVDTALPPLTLAEANGTDVTLQADAWAGRVHVVNFMASWCAPCEAEMDELVALKQAVPGVRYLGIAWNDAPARIEPWLKEHGAPFERVLYDPRGRTAIALGLRGIPETYIVDAKGKVRYQISGMITERSRKERLTPLLEQLTQEAADAR